MYQETSLAKQGAHEKKDIYKRWKWGQATKEEYRNIPQTIPVNLGKFKAQLELKLARDIKGTKKNFYCYVINKRINKENVSPLLHWVDDLVTVSVDKIEILCAFFAFTKPTNKVSQAFLCPEMEFKEKMNYQ